MQLGSMFAFSNLSQILKATTISDPLLSRYENFLTANNSAVIRKVRDLGNNPKRCYRFVVENIKYKSDESNYGKSEFWAYPEETLRRSSGDCEDSAFLIASMFMVLRIECFVRTAYLIDYGSGHAWCYFKLNGQWAPAETTSAVFDPWSGSSKWPYYGPYLPFIDIKKASSHNYTGAELLKQALRIKMKNYSDGQLQLDNAMIEKRKIV
jgi:hypothetical protein